MSTALQTQIPCEGADLPVGLSVVIPCYNSEKSLPPLLARLIPVLQGMGQPYEVILANDGSHDRTWATITELATKYAHVRGIDMMRNYGQHNTLLCGIRAAVYDKTVTIDDDLQNPPEEIAKLLAALERDKLDVVYGPPETEQHGLWRDLASVITKLVLQHAMGAENAKNISAFRVLKTQVREAFSTYQSPYVSIDVLITWATTKFGAVKVQHDARTLGVSNYNLRKLIVHALNMLTGFSTWPLRFASFIGFAFTGLGGLTLIYVLTRYFITEKPVQGFAFLASIIAIFSGAQLFSLGIIGEYLARLHFRMMDRPAYTVREVVSNQEAL